MEVIGHYHNLLNKCQICPITSIRRRRINFPLTSDNSHPKPLPLTFRMSAECCHAIPKHAEQGKDLKITKNILQ